MYAGTLYFSNIFRPEGVIIMLILKTLKKTRQQVVFSKIRSYFLQLSCDMCFEYCLYHELKEVNINNYS